MWISGDISGQMLHNYIYTLRVKKLVKNALAITVKCAPIETKKDVQMQPDVN